MNYGKRNKALSNAPVQRALPPVAAPGSAQPQPGVNLHLDDPQWYLDASLTWGWWKVLDAIILRIAEYGKGGNGADDSLASLLGGGSIAPYLEAAAQLGLTANDVAAGLTELKDPNSRMRSVLADVLRPDFASPQAALAHLKERLAELDPLEARIVLALVAGASRAAQG